MNATVVTQANPLAQLARLRDLLELAARLHELPDPLSSADSLRQALATLATAAQLLGLNVSWLAPLQRLLADDDAVSAALSVARYLRGELERRLKR